MTADSLLDKVNWRLLDKGRPVLVGVSGGTDSLALLYLLNSAGYTVIAAHFNHHLRPDADDDARFVEETARQLGCATIGGVGDVRLRRRRKDLHEAAACRPLQFLFTPGRACAPRAVAVGHNADNRLDGADAILRGSSWQGLPGSAAGRFSSNFNAIPLGGLLGIWRSNLKHTAGGGLTPRFDRPIKMLPHPQPQPARMIPILGGTTPIKQRLYSLEFRRKIRWKSCKRQLIALPGWFRLGEKVIALSTARPWQAAGDRQIEVIRRAAATCCPTTRTSIRRPINALPAARRDGQRFAGRLPTGLSAFTDADRFYVHLGAAPVRDARFPKFLVRQRSY